VDDLIGEFRQFLARGGASGAAASIEALLQIMPEDAANQLRLCAIPHEFNAAILRVLAPQLDDVRAQTRYEEFAQLSCVIQAPDGLSLHESTRRELFAQWLKPARAVTFQAVSARLIAYFDGQVVSDTAATREAVAHKRMFHGLGADQKRGFEEFEMLCRRARHEARLTACATLIRLVHEYDPVLAPERGAWLTYHEGKLALDLQEWSHARTLLTSAMVDPAAPTSLVVRARVRLGYLSGEEGDLLGAIQHYESALATVTQAKPEGTKSYDVLRSLGEAYRDRQEYDRAEALLTQSLTQAQEIGDAAAVADAHNSWGTLHWKRREISEATAAYETSLRVLLNLGRRFQAAQVYNNLGMVYAEQRDWDKAEGSYLKSLAIKREAGDSLGQARTLVNLVQVHRARNDVERAIDACQNAAGLFQSLRHTVGLARAKRMLGRLHLAREDYGQARDVLREAAELFEHCGLVKDAEATREESAGVGRNVTIPWWAWVLIGVAVLALSLAIAVVAVAVMSP
jgi:tetratricopeptide (TPR) repeat protein